MNERMSPATQYAGLSSRSLNRRSRAPLHLVRRYFWVWNPTAGICLLRLHGMAQIVPLGIQIVKSEVNLLNLANLRWSLTSRQNIVCLQLWFAHQLKLATTKKSNHTHTHGRSHKWIDSFMTVHKYIDWYVPRMLRYFHSMYHIPSCISLFLCGSRFKCMLLAVSFYYQIMIRTIRSFNAN